MQSLQSKIKKCKHLKRFVDRFESKQFLRGQKVGLMDLKILNSTITFSSACETLTLPPWAGAPKGAAEVAQMEE